MTLPNKFYIHSRAKETKIKHDFEKEGWYAVRAASSKGIADVVAIRPTKCGHGNHFEVRFVQIKTEIKRKVFKIDYKVEESTCGPINVEWWYFPHKLRINKS